MGASSHRHGRLLPVLAVVGLVAGLSNACGGGHGPGLTSRDVLANAADPADTHADDGLRDPAGIDTASPDALSSDQQAPDDAIDAKDAVPAGPLIHVRPGAVEFWGQLVSVRTAIDVVLDSDGLEDALVTGITLEPAGSATGFALDLSGFADGTIPAPGSPASIAPGTSATFRVAFTPSGLASKDSSGQYVPDRAVVRISYVGGAPIEVPVSGFGVDSLCPIPVLDIEPAQPVLPQSLIHLHGANTVLVGGPITSWWWKVEQPPQHKFHLGVGKTESDRDHEVNVVGDYAYRLDVCDARMCSDNPACGRTAMQPAKVVPPATGIHCELTWQTPGDADEFDWGPGMGSDLDLHVTSSFAGGPDLDLDGRPDGWFDIPYDVFWYNKTPEWGSVNPNVDDNPTLDRDDTDGAGPENYNHRLPLDGQTYRFGVHYWDDQGYGPAFPEVKCYIGGTLAFDEILDNQGVGLVHCDLWEVATIDWPSKAVHVVTNPDGSPKVTPKYANSAFVVVGTDPCQ